MVRHRWVNTIDTTITFLLASNALKRYSARGSGRTCNVYFVMNRRNVVPCPPRNEEAVRCVLFYSLQMLLTMLIGCTVSLTLCDDRRSGAPALPCQGSSFNIRTEIWL